MPKRSLGRAPRTACWVLLGLLAAIIVLSPAFESFDKWDGFPNPDKDIVLNVLAVAVCLAASVSFVFLLLQFFFAGMFAGELPAMYSAKLGAHCQPESVPPSPLCLALRI